MVVSLQAQKGANAMANGGYPVGKYTKVAVHPIQGGDGTLSGGTGTLSDIGVFSCGDFDSGDRPKVDKYYNLSGDKDGSFYEFPRWKCVASGKTSDFKES